MPPTTAVAVAYAIEFYLLIGFVFAAWFAWRGAQRLDSAAANGSLGFRLLLIPQTVVIWPLPLLRLLAGGRQ